MGCCEDEEHACCCAAGPDAEVHFECVSALDLVMFAGRILGSTFGS